MNAPGKADEIKAAITAIIAFVTTLIGWRGVAVLIWLCCIFLDYLAGSMAARRENNWSSAIARDGLWHKLGEIFAVLVASLCDIAMGVVLDGAGIQLPFDISSFIMPIVLTWYTLTEIGSIIENCGRLGTPIPKWFKQYVDKAKGAIDAQQGDIPETHEEGEEK